MYSSALLEFAASSLRLFLRVFATTNEVMKKDHALKSFSKYTHCGHRYAFTNLIKDTGTVEHDELIIIVLQLFVREYTAW